MNATKKEIKTKEEEKIHAQQNNPGVAIDAKSTEDAVKEINPDCSSMDSRG